MIHNIFRKIIITVLLIAAALSIQILNFNFESIFIYSLANNISKYSCIIILLLTIAGILGLTYKNKKSYYKVFLNLELILCYVIFFSNHVLHIYDFNNIHSIASNIVFSISFISVTFLKDYLDEKNIDYITTDNNPIEKYDLLYESRKKQANHFISLIESSKTAYGYSICISGKWGTGKTSFINSVINKIGKGNKYHFVRINAMDLDDGESLVKYFFNIVKQILEMNGFYVGVNSEYQELISSMSGIMLNETLSNFIKGNFVSSADYRVNLQKLSDLLEKELKNKKIIIIVDDLERCEEKVLEFLYFTKEIAMLKRCIVVFLTDYSRLKETINKDDEFLEKFFNYILNLHIVTIDEIIDKNIKDKDFFNIIKDINSVYENNIENIKKSDYLYINDAHQRDEYKEKRISDAINNYDVFISTLKNPRKLLRIYHKYDELIEITKNQNQTEKYIMFLNKVNYKKQILLLSIVFALYPDEYKIIETEDITSYIFGLRNDVDEKRPSKTIRILLEEEWISLVNTYMVNEKIRFISCLLNSPADLPNIANIFTSKQQEYVTEINKNNKPQNVTFANVLKELFMAKFNSDSEKEMFILKTINLYKNELQFDELIYIFSSQSLIHHVAQSKGIIKTLYTTLKDLKIINKQKSLNLFNSFAKGHLYYKLNDITRFVSLISNYNIDYDQINSIILNCDSYNQMIEKYCDKLINSFHLSFVRNNESAIHKLKELCSITKKHCEKNNIDKAQDIINLINNSNDAISSIEYLYKINELINRQESITIQTAEFKSEYLPEVLEQTVSCIKVCSFDELQSLWKKINSMLQSFIHTNYPLTKNDLNNINEIIELYYERMGDVPVSWRKMYIEIKSIFDKKENDTKKEESNHNANIDPHEINRISNESNNTI